MTMTPGSITALFPRVQDGDGGAVEKLWEHFFPRMVELARRRLRGITLHATDPEDIAQSAFHSFCLAGGQGRFPALGDRRALWQLLFTITVRKTANAIQHESRQKRGGGRVTGESSDFAQTLGRDPSPDLVAGLTDSLERLFELLDNDGLRQVAAMMIEGYTMEEIAQHMECSRRTIHRKVELIRRIWQREIEE